ncbi:MAG: deoxyhypusine synthase [Syntrophorhabdaceae bacterium]|nr:deoxyhypusine synthase [Syntrophorhabdaceae bacterium]
MTKRSRFLGGTRILPPPVGRKMSVSGLVDKTFLAYNAGRLREASRLLTERMLKQDVTVGLSLTGALTPAGLGVSCIVPLMKAGFIDWIVSTGANLYHDAHFGLGLPLHAGSPFMDDRVLRDEKVVRIYDVLFSYDVLLDTDAFFRQVVDLPEFQCEMGTAEFHYRLGAYMARRERELRMGDVSILSAGWRYGIPIYTSSPGDSSIGMNVAAMQFGGRGVKIDVSLDVNETAAIVHDAKKEKGKSAVWILGGGSPKNFMLQTEPHVQEVLGLGERGHDYFLQITDARPDTGGLSGATPSEAVSWGKVDPDRLPDTVVCYLDTTVALPVLCACVFDRVAKRRQKRLYDRRGAMLKHLGEEYRKKVSADAVTKKRKVLR